MKITNKLDTSYYWTSVKKNTETRSTGIHTVIPSRLYTELDIEIKSEINDWIKSGKYRTDLLIFRQDDKQDEEWKERVIISRIKRALKLHNNLFGRMIITEDIDKIVLAWTNKE